MTPPIQDRTAARHLTRHFFNALFDFGILTEAGADSFKRLLLGTVGAFYGAGLILTRLYLRKYAALGAADTPGPYRRALLGDDLLIIGFPMLVVAVVTLLVSHSLYPDERDVRVLAPLPVPKALIFTTKLAALFLFAGLLIGVVHLALMPMTVLTSFNAWREESPLLRLIAMGSVGAAASTFAVLAVSAITGVIGLLLSRSRLHGLTALSTSVLLGALALCLPLVLHFPALGDAFSSQEAWIALLPPAWFVGLQRVLVGSADPWHVRLAVTAVTALGAAGALVATSYAIRFRRLERFVLRPPARPRARAARPRLSLGGSPAYLAVSRFTTTTLGRSPLHQGTVVGLSAAGGSLAVAGLIGEPASAVGALATWIPFVLMLGCGLAIRTALALPMDHRANWIFRITEDEQTRRDQMRAVDRVVTVWVVGVPVAAALPIFWMHHRPFLLVAVLLIALVGLVFAHIVLRDWRRIPFTCSYLPGKRFIGHSLLLGTTAYWIFPLVGGGLLRVAMLGPRQAVVVGLVLLALALWLRRRRLTRWAERPLLFDDELPDVPQLLHL